MKVYIIPITEKDLTMWRASDVAELCSIPHRTVTFWVTHGYLRPARRGAMNDAPHLFSDRQLMALAYIGVLRKSERQCSPAYAGKVVRWFEDMTDSEFDAWLGVGNGELAADPAWVDPCAKHLPCDEYIAEEMAAADARVRAAILARRATEKASGKKIVPSSFGPRAATR
jgi:DNA-binding transcriptional MerR regulator